MKIYTLFLITIFSFLACKAQQKDLEATKINFQVNYNVIHKEDSNSKKILIQWEMLLNRNHLSDFQDTEMLRNWLTTDLFPYPNRFLGFLRDIKKNASQSQVTVIGLYPVARDTYALKTMFSYMNTKTQKIELDNILTVYVVQDKNEFKFMCSPQWYANQWNTKQIGKCRYFFAKTHVFNETNGIRMDSFNTAIAKVFRLSPLSFKYFVCANSIESYYLAGCDFLPEQYVYSTSGAFTDPVQQVIFAGNATEYYPHEVVHLYLYEIEQKNDLPCHYWFKEGIATFFGGSRGYLLEWHLKKLKIYLDQHDEELLNDISKLSSVPNGEYTTEYPYVIGGLICKKIYEKEGMDGLFELLKAGSSDADFYKMIEKKFNVKKENFGTFIRAELKNY
ncbi:MAG: hypothetical protein RLZZ628_2645 [Bacteroidota bacterium]|jgi:hypothetical protein